MSAVMTTTLPTPEATRLRRPSWRDRRLIIGVLLVLTSALLGARVVAAADRTVPVYAAGPTLPVGAELRTDRLRVVRVRLDSAAPHYLSAEHPLPADRVLVRPVGSGELLPVTAVGVAADLSRRPLGIPVEGTLPADLAPGGLVDVWASARDRKAGGNVYASPQRLAAGAPVSQVSTPASGLSVGRASTVYVLLDEAALARVLGALANGARTVLVPVPGSVPSLASARQGGTR